jgi:hypothetical protein
MSVHSLQCCTRRVGEDLMVWVRPHSGLGGDQGCTKEASTYGAIVDVTRNGRQLMTATMSGYTTQSTPMHPTSSNWGGHANGLERNSVLSLDLVRSLKCDFWRFLGFLVAVSKMVGTQT